MDDAKSEEQTFNIILLQAPRRGSRFVAATLSPFDATLVPRFEAGSGPHSLRQRAEFSAAERILGGRSTPGGTIATYLSREGFLQQRIIGQVCGQKCSSKPFL
jgi:hypothetical protein